MPHRVASLLLAFAFISAPVFAQGPPAAGGGVVQSLASDIAALTARVAKLEGDIVASDLAGTYNFIVLDTSMNAVVTPATISTSAIRATLTLNADGTGFGSAGTCEGSTLTLAGTMTGLFGCGGSLPNVTWTYANGVITITFLDEGEQIPFSVALGGRLLIVAFSPFHPSDPSSDHVLMIAARLR
jgi:hypothetical protein